MGSDVSQPYWDKDADHPKCRKCEAAFGLLNRRHHCRCCFRIFCGNCTPARGNPQGLPYNEPVRMCEACGGNARAKRQCNCRPDLAHIRKAAGGAAAAGASNAAGGGGGAVNSGNADAGGGNADDRKAAATAESEQNKPDEKPEGDSSANQAASQDQIARDAEEAARRKIDSITRQLNDEIINLGPFQSSDYGLFFSEDPVYGMRIATVQGPVAFALPPPDPANVDGVAQLLCGEASAVPHSLEQLHSTPLPLVVSKA